MKQDTKRLTRASAIAGLYVYLTILSQSFGLASGEIQIRLSETLTLMPILFPESVWGLFAGCLVSNILTGCVVWDVIFGSLATLIGAFFTLKLKKHTFLASLCPVISNSVIVPFVLKYAYGIKNAWWLLTLSIGAGEAVCCMIIAPVIIEMLKKHKIK